MILRVIAIAVAGVVLTACVKTLKETHSATPLSSLAGSEWGPEFVAELEAGPSDATSSEPEQFVAFKTGGEVIGHGGCNRFFGSYTQNGQALSFGPLASTRMACPDMTSEYNFLETLKNTRTAEATHLKLILKDEAGETLMTLSRRDWD